MAGEALRPTGSTNEKWDILSGDAETRGGRTPEQLQATQQELGKKALNATPKPGAEAVADAGEAAADPEKAKRIAELENQIKQFENNKRNAQEMLAALERKNPSEKKGAKKREQNENRIRNAKAAIARHDQKLTELRGELAHLVTGDGTPNLTVLQGGGEDMGGQTSKPDLTVIEGGKSEQQGESEAAKAPEYVEQEDGQMMMAEFAEPAGAEAAAEVGEAEASGLEAATDRNGNPAYSQQTIANRKALGLEGDPAEEERQEALAKAKNEGYELAQNEMKNILQGRTPQEAIDAMAKDAAQVIQEMNQMSRSYFFDEKMRAAHERREEEARNDLNSLLRRIQMVQAIMGEAAPVELPSLMSDEGLLNGETGELETAAKDYEDNEFLNGKGAAEVDTMEPEKQTAEAILLSQAEAVAKALGDPTIVERMKAKSGNSFDESVYGNVIEFGSKQFEAEQAAKKSGESNAEAAEPIFESAEKRDEAEKRVGNKLKKRGGMWNRVKAAVMAGVLSIMMICNLTGCGQQQAEALVNNDNNMNTQVVTMAETPGLNIQLDESGETVEDGWETLWNEMRQNRTDFNDIEGKGGSRFAYIYSKGFEDLSGNQEATTEAILDNTEKLPPAMAALAFQMPDLMDQLKMEFNLPDFPGGNSIEQAQAFSNYLYDAENGGDIQQRVLEGVRARMTAEEASAKFWNGNGNKVITTFVYNSFENDDEMLLGKNNATRDADDYLVTYTVPAYDEKGEIVGYNEITFRMNCGGQIDIVRNNNEPDTPQLPPGDEDTGTPPTVTPPPVVTPPPTVTPPTVTPPTIVPPTVTPPTVTPPTVTPPGTVTPPETTPPVTPPETPPVTPPVTPPETPPVTPPETPPVTPPVTPPETPPVTPPETPPETPPVTPPETPPVTPPVTPPETPAVKNPESLVEGLSPDLNGEVGKTEDVNTSAGEDVAGKTENETITPGQSQDMIDSTEVKNEEDGKKQEEANKSEITGDISQSDFEDTMNDLNNLNGFTGGQNASATADGGNGAVEVGGGNGAGGGETGGAQLGGAGAAETGGAGQAGGGAEAGGAGAGGAATETGGAGGIASADQLGGQVSNDSQLGGVTDASGNPVAPSTSDGGNGAVDYGNQDLGNIMDDLLGGNGFQG